jgi:hypothetical protein
MESTVPNILVGHTFVHLVLAQSKFCETSISERLSAMRKQFCRQSDVPMVLCTAMHYCMHFYFSACFNMQKPLLRPNL